MQKRLNTFDVPHKGIRNALMKLILAAGNTDHASEDDLAGLYSLGRDAFTLLKTHARDENEVTLKALEDKLPGSSAHDLEEHELIEQDQAQLEQLLEDIRQRKNTENDLIVFYKKLNNFFSMYLKHMAHEESETQNLLWEHFTDEELAGHRTKIMQNLDPEILLLWFKYVIPAQNHRERSLLLRGFKANAPTEFFNRAIEVIRTVLPDGSYIQLRKALA